MKNTFIALATLMSLSAFAAQIPVENPQVRLELQKAINEATQVHCEHSGTKVDYRYSDSDMLTYIKNGPALASLTLYVDQASATTLILKGKVGSNDGNYTLSYGLSDDLNHIINARYTFELETSASKNTGNILKPKYETVISRDRQMDANCQIISR